MSESEGVVMIIQRSKRKLYHCLFGLDDAIVGGVLGVAGDLFGAGLASSAQDKAISANREMQQTNIAWQKAQLQNKHFWEVGDLRQAGLNPILSAMNGSSAVSAGTPSSSPVNPDLKISRTLEAIANSALAKKEMELKDFTARSDRIRAEADMLRARNDEARTPSAIESAQSQADLNLTNIWRISKLTPLEEAYTKANIDKTQQDMLNSIAQVQALVTMYDRQGRAALMMGSAAQSSAAAANRSAAAQEIIAQVAAQNGVSERALKDALAGKASQETLEAAARTEEVLQHNKNLDWQLKRDMYHNPNAAGRPTGPGSGNMLFGFGELLRNGLGGSLNFSVRP